MTETSKRRLDIQLAHDVDAALHLVALDPAQRPEEWSVEFTGKDGTTETLTGGRYCQFPGLYFHRNVLDLVAWGLPTRPGEVRVSTPDGLTAVLGSQGWR